MNIATILGRRVEWFYGTDSRGRVGSGIVVAYTDRPQVLIEADDGDKVWWAVELTRDVTCDHCGGTGMNGGGMVSTPSEDPKRDR